MSANDPKRTLAVALRGPPSRRVAVPFVYRGILIPSAQSNDHDGPANLLGLCVSLKTLRFFLAVLRRDDRRRR